MGWQLACLFKLVVLCPLAEAQSYLEGVFTPAGAEIPTKLLDQIVHLSNGHPYYVQLLGYFSWELWFANHQNWERVTPDMILSAAFQQEANTFENEMSLLTTQQRQVYRAIAAQPLQAISSQEFLTAHRLPGHSSVRKAVQKLEIF